MNLEGCRFCGATQKDGDVAPWGDEDCCIFCGCCGAYSATAHADTKEEARLVAWQFWNAFQFAGSDE